MKKNISEDKCRMLCTSCLQPGKWCYCKHIKSFDPMIDFVILQHPLERRRRIATGRMAFLSLVGAHIIHGYDFSGDPNVNALINDPARHCMILYPEAPAFDLDTLTEVEKKAMLPEGKRLTMFVIDGTWSTAKKSVYRSCNLRALPRLFFTPATQSQFKIRNQPHENCFSTIEAVHQCIDLLAGAVGYDKGSKKHDQLLHVFDIFVQQHIDHKNMLRQSGQGLAPRRMIKKSRS